MGMGESLTAEEWVLLILTYFHRGIEMHLLGSPRNFVWFVQKPGTLYVNPSGILPKYWHEAHAFGEPNLKQVRKESENAVPKFTNRHLTGHAYRSSVAQANEDCVRV